MLTIIWWCSVAKNLQRVKQTQYMQSEINKSTERGVPVILNIFLNVTARKCNGEGNGTPLQYSCLENPADEGAW